MRFKTVFIQLIILFFVSCTEEDFAPRGSQLLLNPNLSLYPDNVFPWVPSNNSSAGVSSDEFVSGNRSLFIQSLDTAYLGGGNWTQTYTGPMPAPRSTLELLVFIKGENIRTSPNSTGKITVFFRVDPSKDSGGRSAGAQNEIEGNFDWYLLKATLESFPEDAESIRVSLNVPDLTYGKVYFDEINLTVK